MKKQIWYLALLLFGTFDIVSGFAHGDSTMSENFPGSESACPAPPPAYFIVTNVTPTSIALTWGPGALSTYYKLEGFDNSNFTPLPTIYTTSLAYTYSGLTPGHNYTFTLRASYCPGGEWGDSITLNKSTPIIIIEDIVELQNQCTPGISMQTGPNVELDICVQKSTSINPPYNNAFISIIEFDDDVLQFFIAYVGTNAHIGLMNYNGLPPNPLLYFDYTPGTSVGESIDCFHKGTKLFSIDNLYMTGVLFNEAFMTISFDEELENFTYCGSCIEERSPHSAISGAAPGATSTPKPNIISTSILSPNPFNTSTTFQYELAEESAVEIGLYDAMGRMVCELEKIALQAAGRHEVFVDGTGIPNGVYFLRLQTDRNWEVFTLVKQE